MEEKKRAVALRYEQSKDQAPIVVAKGTGELAERIIETAKKHGVPVLEDKVLLSALMRVEVYEEIPPELYRAVAKVLLFVRSIKRSG
ncbi:MAG: EscU/YscU/HrcU family type III secretion system export apparatus switch protein [Aquificaceae bacterium]|nr:EscU/YscU/HrcU family type III secretion system export apparatus switch protein [Aquificaceae bacterium]MCX7990371.1 EscU/YscU/HrcU family type III secretion system export apparatus switch protein [Aquificaceae bacterium]MDW8032994.1 EscU/YscU/HrcU family type III secretion system export apparatus switch protein [Aquificaceae bacterium]